MWPPGLKCPHWDNLRVIRDSDTIPGRAQITYRVGHSQSYPMCNMTPTNRTPDSYNPATSRCPLPFSNTTKTPIATAGGVRETSMLVRRDFNSYAPPNMKAAVALAVRTKLPYAINTEYKIFRYFPFLERLFCSVRPSGSRFARSTIGRLSLPLPFPRFSSNFAKSFVSLPS